MVSDIFLAIKNDDFTMLKSIFEKNELQLPISQKGDTLLHYAIAFSRKDIVEYLIKTIGVDINIINNAQETPLSYAIRFKELDIALSLLIMGANVNVEDENKNTPLHFASIHAHLDGYLDLMELLITNSADVNKKNYYGHTPLHCAVINNNKLAVEKLLLNRADVDQVDLSENSSLHYAANRNLDILNMLILNGASVNKINKFGNTALHYAITYGDMKIIDSLLQNGALDNLQDDNIFLQQAVNSYFYFSNKNSDGQTLLHLAVKYESLAIIDIFLQKNISFFSEKDKSGITPLDIASDYIKEKFKEKSEIKFVINLNS